MQLWGSGSTSSTLSCTSSNPRCTLSSRWGELLSPGMRPPQGHRTQSLPGLRLQSALGDRLLSVLDGSFCRSQLHRIWQVLHPGPHGSHNNSSASDCFVNSLQTGMERAPRILVKPHNEARKHCWRTATSDQLSSLGLRGTWSDTHSPHDQQKTWEAWNCLTAYLNQLSDITGRCVLPTIWHQVAMYPELGGWAGVKSPHPVCF